MTLTNNDKAALKVGTKITRTYKGVEITFTISRRTRDRKGELCLQLKDDTGRIVAEDFDCTFPGVVYRVAN